jgi:hypothetical protein
MGLSCSAQALGRVVSWPSQTPGHGRMKGAGYWVRLEGGISSPPLERLGLNRAPRAGKAVPTRPFLGLAKGELAWRV